MITFLLLISLLLHLVTFIIFKNMNSRLQQADQLAIQQKQTIKEIEDLFSIYLVEMKEENAKLIDLLSELEHSQQNDSSLSNSEQTTTDTYEKNSIKESKVNPIIKKTPVESEYVPPMINHQQDTVEQSVSASVFSLHDQGLSVEEIAKKLDCGKTEVELMLKFHRKNS